MRSKLRSKLRPIISHNKAVVGKLYNDKLEYIFVGEHFGSLFWEHFCSHLRVLVGIVVRVPCDIFSWELVHIYVQALDDKLFWGHYGSIFWALFCTLFWGFGDIFARQPSYIPRMRQFLRKTAKQ